jgi:3-oxoacyl-[acyl-carrier-protein] synthase II
MRVFLSGAAILRKRASASLRSSPLPMDGPGLFHDVRLQDEFSGKFSRFGRYDHYTRMGCAAVFLALRDAGRDAPVRPGNTGFLLAGQYGSFETDLAYYRTTLDGGLASPNLFSYTLPNIVIGECALQFGLLGPTYCLDAEGGRAAAALGEASYYLETRSAEAMLVGWLEALPAQAPAGEEGAMILLFEANGAQAPGTLELLTDGRRGLKSVSGIPIESLDDVFRTLSGSGYAGSPFLQQVVK